VPIFLIGSEYWKKLDSFFKSNAADAEEFDSSDFVHYKITDDLDEVVKAANQVIKPL